MVLYRCVKLVTCNRQLLDFFLLWKSGSSRVKTRGGYTCRRLYIDAHTSAEVGRKIESKGDKLKEKVYKHQTTKPNGCFFFFAFSLSFSASLHAGRRVERGKKDGTNPR